VGARHRYRRLALLLLALAAAAVLVAVPLVARALRDTATSCLGPDDRGVVSIGTGVGAGVLALTVHPDTATRVTASLRMASGPLSATASTLWVSGSGVRSTAFGRRGTGCWQGGLPRAAIAAVSVRTSSVASGPVLARFALPPALPSAAVIVGRARAATLALTALRERSVGRSSVHERPQAVETLYAGDRVVSRSRYGVQRFAWRGWREGFAWVVPGLHASVILGHGTLGRVPVIIVAGAVVQTPLWMVLQIDAASGAVLADSMNGPHHIMANAYDPLVR
jgi:hypothetical protein